MIFVGSQLPLVHAIHWFSVYLEYSTCMQFIGSQLPLAHAIYGSQLPLVRAIHWFPSSLAAQLPLVHTCYSLAPNYR